MATAIRPAGKGNAVDTLADWLALTGNTIIRDDAGGLCVTCGIGASEPERWRLFRLADVTVSSVCGSVVWLVRARSPLLG